MVPDHLASPAVLVTACVHEPGSGPSVHADDPLLPAPTTWVTDPHDAPDGVDPLEHAFLAVTDYFAFNAVALPALDNRKRPVVPPDEHVLDHLARAWELVDPEEALLRPEAATVYVTNEVLPCDLCGHGTARYETMLTGEDGQRYGASVCLGCLQRRGATTLGAGNSTYLVTFAEVSPAVRAVVDELCARQARDPIWPGEPVAGWRREYYRAGFTAGDEGRMVREFFGSTLVAVSDGPECTRLEVRSYLADLHFMQRDHFALPASWTSDQIRSCLLRVLPNPISRPLPAEFEIDLPTAEQCTQAALDAIAMPVSLADDALTTGVQFSVPRGDSWVTRCAKITASRSSKQQLVGRLVLENASRAVREAAVTSPSCPHHVLLAVAGPGHPELWLALLRRQDLDEEILDRLTDTALRGATTDSGIPGLVRAAVLHPRCRADAVPALADRVRHGAPPTARAHLARDARTLPTQHRRAIYTQLLLGTRSGALSDGVLDAIIDRSAEPSVNGKVDSGELTWLLTHADRGIRRVAHRYALARGLIEGSAPSPVPGEVSAGEGTDRPAIDDVAVAVRLRLAWRETIGPWLEATEHDLGPAWRHCGLHRRGLFLEVLSPYEFGEGDPFAAGVGAEVGRMLSERTDGRVDRVQWRYAGSTSVPQARARATELDAFHPGDPLAGEEATAAGIARRLRVDAGSPAASALAAVRVAAISAHWIWLVVADEAGRRAIGTTPGASGQLFEAIRKLQGRPRPLYSLYVDAVAWDHSYSMMGPDPGSWTRCNPALLGKRDDPEPWPARTTPRSSVGRPSTCTSPLRARRCVASPLTWGSCGAL